MDLHCCLKGSELVLYCLNGRGLGCMDKDCLDLSVRNSLGYMRSRIYISRTINNQHVRPKHVEGVSIKSI